MCPGCYKALWSPFISKNRTRPHESHTQPRAVCVYCVCVHECNILSVGRAHALCLTIANDTQRQRLVYTMCRCRDFVHTLSAFNQSNKRIRKKISAYLSRLITRHHLKYRKYRIVCTLSVSTVDVKQKIVILSFSKQRLVNKQARVGYYYPTAHTRIHADIKAGAVFITVPH